MKAKTGLMGGKATIYGTDWCGFTTKQKNNFDEKKIPYDYVNCEAQAGSCEGITSYPMVKNYGPKNEEWVGFREI